MAVPLTAETKGLVGAAFLASMAHEWSMCREVRTGQLVAELSTGSLMAALDVTDPEPLPAGHALCRTQNTPSTPHVGGHTAPCCSGLRSC
ncbi:NAD(P)-dependent oxidoreductase [Arthrobacter sp. VKM Ac-2550]|uniref:NAD(P)-dependent oxidoreductase n=1 Tax=Crystallibacter permensis TaxID=1938888 RepID=UPI0039B4C904